MVVSQRPSGFIKAPTKACIRGRRIGEARYFMTRSSQFVFGLFNSPENFISQNSSWEIRSLSLCACHLCIYLYEGDDWLTETHLWKLVFRAKQSSISTEVSSKKSGLGNNKNIYILEQISSQEQPYTRRLRSLLSKTVKISSLMHFSNSIAVAVLFACLTRSILFKWIYRGTSLSSGLGWAEYRAPAYFINRRRD